MTREEKAKAYDEAMKLAKEWKKKYGSTISSDGTMAKDFDAIFPELAESEDERIRRWLVELVENQEPKMFIEVKKMNVFAWLEKQKDSVSNAKYIEDVAHAFEDGRKNGIEEKQKEQKPAESISHLTVQGKGVYKICPRCKERMVRDDSMVYTSMPPQYCYECPKCGERECDTVIYDNPEMVEQKPAEDKELLKNILFQKKGITYDDYKCKNDPYVGLSFYELIKCLEEYDKARSNR